jgi:hypothetical protein
MNSDSEERNTAPAPMRKALLMNSGAIMYICGKIREEFRMNGGTTGTDADHGLRSGAIH